MLFIHLFLCALKPGVWRWSVGRVEDSIYAITSDARKNDMYRGWIFQGVRSDEDKQVWDLIGGVFKGAKGDKEQCTLDTPDVGLLESVDQMSRLSESSD